MKILEKLLLVREMITQLLFIRLSTSQRKYKINRYRFKKTTRLNADPKTIQQINFTENLGQARNRKFFLFEDVKESNLDFSQGTVPFQCSEFVLVK